MPPASSAVPVTVRVPGKLNLSLAVGARRRDGFHDLATVYQAVSVYDTVTAAPGRGVTVELAGTETAGVPAGHDNLAARAAIALAEAVGIRPAVRLTVHKGIPVAGGMAGGSADAAAALVACDVLWGTGLAREDLAEVAAQVGSDVAFLLHGGNALGTGRGERLSPVLGRGTYHWALALAPEGLSTAAVYAELDRLRGGRPVPEPEVPPELLGALRNGDATALGRALTNDLQAAATSLRPGLARTVEAGRDLGAIGGIVSGSGPTCAFLCADEAAAIRLAAALAGTGLCRSTLVAFGPVGGPRRLGPDESPEGAFA